VDFFLVVPTRPLVASIGSFVCMALAVAIIGITPQARGSFLILASTSIRGFELKALGNARVSDTSALAFSIVKFATATIILTGILARNRFMTLAVAIIGRTPLAWVSFLILASTSINGFEFKALGNSRVSNTATLAFTVIQLATKIAGCIDNSDGSAEDDKGRELHDSD
jgi:hypothetical protein